MNSPLEQKFCRMDAALEVKNGVEVSGYASVFGQVDQGGDIVEPGAYAQSLAALTRDGWRVKMLWQHDPAQPIGVWDEVREDAKGLFVRGRLLENVAKAREVAALIEAGAIDGLSIGYRTKRARKNGKGQRLLSELELWEVSLVTFPMLPSARVDSKGEALPDDPLRELAGALEGARRIMAGL